jgi:hypothetical protein
LAELLTESDNVLPMTASQKSEELAKYDRLSRLNIVKKIIKTTVSE